MVLIFLGRTDSNNFGSLGQKVYRLMEKESVSLTLHSRGTPQKRGAPQFERWAFFFADQSQFCPVTNQWSLNAASQQYGQSVL